MDTYESVRFKDRMNARANGEQVCDVIKTLYYNSGNEFLAGFECYDYEEDEFGDGSQITILSPYIWIEFE